MTLSSMPRFRDRDLPGKKVLGRKYTVHRTQALTGKSHQFWQNQLDQFVTAFGIEEPSQFNTHRKLVTRPSSDDPVTLGEVMVITEYLNIYRHKQDTTIGELAYIIARNRPRIIFTHDPFIDSTCPSHITTSQLLFEIQWWSGTSASILLQLLRDERGNKTERYQGEGRANADEAMWTWIAGMMFREHSSFAKRDRSSGGVLLTDSEMGRLRSMVSSVRHYNPTDVLELADRGVVDPASIMAALEHGLDYDLAATLAS